MNHNLEPDKLIAIETADFAELLRNEERIEIIRRLLAAESIVTEATLKAILDYKEPAKTFEAAALDFIM